MERAGGGRKRARKIGQERENREVVEGNTKEKENEQNREEKEK